MFSGLVFCEDCDGTLVLHRAHTMESTKNNFMCSTYKKRGKEECTSHYIRESQLTAIILDDLKRVTHFARQQEKLFAEHINQRNSFETRKELTKLQRELDNMKRRDSELTILFSDFMRIMSLEESQMNTSECCLQSTQMNKRS